MKRALIIAAYVVGAIVGIPLVGVIGGYVLAQFERG